MLEIVINSLKNYDFVNIYLLILKLFQTCMSFFLLLKTKEDIFKNVGNIFFCVHQKK